MVQLCKTHEWVILYIIGMAYPVIGLFMSMNQSGDTSLSFLRFGILIVLLYIVREIIMYRRLRKMQAHSICDHKLSTYVVRGIGVILFFVLFWISDGLMQELLLIVVAMIAQYLLPRPVSEGVFVTNQEVIIRGKVIPYANIDIIEKTPVGDVRIVSGKDEQMVMYHTKEQKKRIYDTLAYTMQEQLPSI